MSIFWWDRAVEAEPAEPEEEREIQHVWALSVCDISGLPLDVLSVCDNSDLQSDESGNLSNMITNSGAEEHVVSSADWKSLGEPLLPAQVRLRSAIGDDMGVSGSFMVRGRCDNQMVELTALVATRATRSLCSATKLVNPGYSTETRPTQSVFRRRGGFAEGSDLRLPLEEQGVMILGTPLGHAESVRKRLAAVSAKVGRGFSIYGALRSCSSRPGQITCSEWCIQHSRPSLRLIMIPGWAQGALFSPQALLAGRVRQTGST